MKKRFNEITLDYPFINTNCNKFLLSIYPQWHSRLLPDSILKNESKDAIVIDVSHTNSIHKVYLTKMTGVDSLQHGDILVIYRTSDGMGPAYYRSVATSICVVDEVLDISTFATYNDFLSYTQSYSIFTKEELNDLYINRKYPFIVKFNYNYALPKRVTRQEMLEEINIRQDYWGFFQLTDDQFYSILQKGNADASITFN
jgi:hypothetical protein